MLMRSKQKNGREFLKKLLVPVLILSFFLLPVNAENTQTFYMENNTGLNFMDGYYKIELIEISKPGDVMFVKLKLITDGKTDKLSLYQNEDTPINNAPFNRIYELNFSSYSQTVAKISVKFPDAWSSPEKYDIEVPVEEQKIPNLVMTKSVDKNTIKKGDVVEFKIVIENNGNGSAGNMTLEDRMPPGFMSAPGSRYPPVLPNEIKAGEKIELFFALKAVEAGDYVIDPSTVKYNSNTSRSNSLTISVLDEKKEKSNISTDIVIDRNDIFTGESIKAAIKVTNNGNVTAESILIEGAVPEGLEITNGDLRQVYQKIEAGDSEEYSATLKAVKAGNYTLTLKTTYSDDTKGFSSNSNAVVVKEKEDNYIYIIIPAVIIIVGISLFIIKRHREYSF